MPDPRFFPPVREAAKVCEFVRKLLVKERHRGPIELEAYPPYCHWSDVDRSTPSSETNLDENATDGVVRQSASDLTESVPARTGERGENAAISDAALALESAERSLAASSARVDEMSRRIEGLVSEKQ